MLSKILNQVAAKLQCAEKKNVFISIFFHFFVKKQVITEEPYLIASVLLSMLSVSASKVFVLNNTLTAKKKNFTKCPE